MTILGFDTSKPPSLLLILGLFYFTISLALFFMGGPGVSFLIPILWIWVATKNPHARFMKDPHVRFVPRLPQMNFYFFVTKEQVLSERAIKIPFAKTVVSLGIISLALVLLPLGFGSSSLYAIVIGEHAAEGGFILVQSAKEVLDTGGNGRLAQIAASINISEAGDLKAIMLQVYGEFLTEVGADAVKDYRKKLEGAGIAATSIAAKIILKTIVLWVEMIIGAIVLNILYKYGHYLVILHRWIIGIVFGKEQAENINAVGERMQFLMERFFVGWMKIAAVLIVLLFITFTIMPLQLDIFQVVFLAFFMGFLTSIFKVGGLAATILATLLMIVDIRPELGWWWSDFTFTLGGFYIDHFVKIVLMFVAVKSKGLVESYYLTPAIIADELNIPKIAIIIAVIPTAMSHKLTGMAAGLNLMFLLFAIVQVVWEKNPELKAKYDELTKALTPEWIQDAKAKADERAKRPPYTWRSTKAQFERILYGKFADQ